MITVLNKDYWLKQQSENIPNRIAIIEDQKKYTYNELFGLAKKASVLFQKRGIKKGDHVSIVSKNNIEFTQAGDSFRHGMFFALIFVGMLILQSFRMLTLWNAGLFIIGIGLLEFYFASRK